VQAVTSRFPALAVPESDWTRRVTELRITEQDRKRPFIIRGLLLATLAGLFAVMPGTPWWAWALLIPGVVQTGMELLLESLVRDKFKPVDPNPVTVPLIDIHFRNHERLMLYPTGLIGTIAVLSNVVAVLFAAPPTGGWLKVAAFAGSLLYLNSGVLGPLVDVTAYSPKQLTWPVLRVLRPHLWIPILGLGVGTVWATSAWWSPQSLPYAYLGVLLTAYIGIRIREYERAMAAGEGAHEELLSDRSKEAALTLHELLQVVKGPLVEAAHSPTMSVGDRVEVLAFIDNVEHIYQEAREQRTNLSVGLLPSGTAIVRRTCLRHAVEYRTDIQFEDFRIDSRHNDQQGILPMDRVFANQLISTLTNNVVQAYDRNPDAQRSFTVRAHAVDGQIIIEATDTLGLMPPSAWAGPNTTMGHIAAKLADREGTLTQQAEADGGKTITATWKMELPFLKGRE